MSRERKASIATSLTALAFGGVYAVKEAWPDELAITGARLNEHGGVTLILEECQQGELWLIREEFLSRPELPNGQVGERRLRSTNKTRRGNC
jgi:hypothetical protein